jgi:hypothetical protein
MKEVTGRPVISERAKMVKGRSHDVRMRWKQEKEQKVYIMKTQQLSQLRDIEEEHLNRQGKYLNKQSERYLSRKENMNMQPLQVEERLITYGKYSQAKKE